MVSSRSKNRIESFGFKPGLLLINKYEVVKKLGEGFEGEVYLLRERSTGIDRAAKFFFPHRNLKNKTLNLYAKKLHKLRHCSIVIQYYTQEKIRYQGHDVTFLISEFVEGELLQDFLKRQPGKRLLPFQAVHLLYSLVQGLLEIHRVHEYHGDLHSENIIVNRFGLRFELKLIDMYSWHNVSSKPTHIKDDICDVIKIFYDSLGGKKHYAKQPQIVKEICCGLKKSLILKKFRSLNKLREFLEHMSW